MLLNIENRVKPALSPKGILAALLPKRRLSDIIALGLSFILCCSISMSFGQKTISITIAKRDSVNAAIQVIAWSKGKQYELGKDSLRKFSALIKIPDTLPKGMLSLVFQVGGKNINELKVVYTGEDIKLHLEPASNQTHFVVTGTGETPDYYLFHLKIDSLQGRIIKYREIMGGLINETGFVDKTQMFSDKDNKAIDSLFTVLHTKFSGKLFVHYIDAIHYRFPNMKSGLKVQRRDANLHYFDYFNPMDSLLLNSSFYNAKVEDFLQLASFLVTDGDSLAIKKAIDVYMNKVAASQPLSRTVALLMRTWLNKNAHDMELEYLDENFLAKQCYADGDIDLQQRLKAYKRLAVGKPAPEIVYTDEHNKECKLSDLKSEYIIVLFWATWCEHCQKLVPALYKYTETKPNIRVIAIGVDEDEAYWKSVIKYFPDWINLRAAEKWNNINAKNYGVSGTPTLYLLDKNHRILKKVNEVADLQAVVEGK